MAERVQLRRTKGWRMPENTVKVDRSTKWGNPFPTTDGAISADEAVERFRRLAYALTWLAPQAKAELRGKNLACWCKPGQPCHADVLIKIANEE